MNTDKDNLRLSALILKLIERSIRPDEMQELNDWLGRSPEAFDFYREHVKNMVVLKHRDRPKAESEPPLEKELWTALAQEEQTAPAIQPFADPSPILVPDVRQRKQELRRLQSNALTNKPLLLTTIASLAALVLMIAYVRMIPQSVKEPVATLQQTIQAKWVDNGVPMPTGARLMNLDPPFALAAGMAEIIFDNGTRLVVESPAEFQIITSNQIQLNYGRIFVEKTGSASEFTVQSKNAKIIDISTAFGVYADLQGQTELHVIEGETLLISGLQSESKTVENVTAGQALGVDLNGSPQSVAFRNHQFVREIDAELGIAWRGHRQLDLASITSGADGLVTREGVFTINPLTGERGSSISGKGRRSNAQYNPVPDSPYVDGVFVPFGGTNTITSAGHVFECPETERYFTRDITVLNGSAALERDGLRPGIVGNQLDLLAHLPRIMLHSNAGITYNLSAIRRLVGSAGNKPCRFQALSETRQLNQRQEGHLDFYIVVDGQVRFEKVAFTSEDGRIELDMTFGPEDRFLSLIVTDCMQKDPVKGGACNNDFLYLIGPTLNWE
jgi:hypothetical protein